MIKIEEINENLMNLEEIYKRHPDLKTTTETKLLQDIQYASDMYYNHGRSIMSDERFDSMEIVFKDRFPWNKKILEVGSKVEKLKGFNKVEHTRLPGVTQHKAQTLTELEEFCNLAKIKEEEFVISEKLDGSSLYALYNKEGDLIQVASRGDGDIGEDITKNSGKIQGLLKKIDTSKYLEKYPNLENIEIRGEALILNKDFIELNRRLVLENLTEAVNARNASAGLLRRLDSKNVELITFKCYEEIIELDTKEVIQRNQIEKMETLKELGFDTPWYEKVKYNDLENIYINYIENKRPKLRGSNDGYEIDGLVIVVNDINTQIKRGMTNNRSNSSIAIKFPPELAISKLINIEYSMGNTGVITPVAVIDPVFVGGVTITNISLANEDIMNGLLLKKGDNIEISRRNDVIPKIEKNLKLERVYIYIQKVFNLILEEIDLLNQDNLKTFKENIEFELTNNFQKFELAANKIINSNSQFKIEKTESEIKGNIVSDIFSILRKNNKNIVKDINLLQVNINSKLETIDESIDFKELTKDKEVFLTNCPICGGVLVSDNSSKLCNNNECFGVKQGKIVYFLKTNEQTIRKNTIADGSQSGIGEGKIKQLLEMKLINSIKDLFLLKEENFIIDGKYIENFGVVSVNNLLKDIEKLKTLKDSQFLAGLNFKFFSEKRFEKILKVFSLKDFLDNKISKEQISSIENFGDILAESLIKEFQEKKEEILKLIEIITVLPTPKQEKNLNSQKFVITGSVKDNGNDNSKLTKKIVEEAGFKYDRSGLTKYLESLGHSVSGSVTSKTNYLINDDIDSSSGKNKTAKELNIPIISPESIINVLANNVNETLNQVKETKTTKGMSL